MEECKCCKGTGLIIGNHTCGCCHDQTTIEQMKND